MVENGERPLKFFGRRKGRPLSPTRENLVEDLLPRITVPVEAAENTSLPLDITALFPGSVSQQRWLEIGFGGGEHLAALASRHRDTGFIGCEPYINGVAKLLSAIDRDGLENVRIFPDDVRRLLAVLPSASIDRIYILFPDPWPKRRHWQRRIVGPGTLPDLARILRPGGDLILATDHPDYLTWMLRCVRGRAEFVWSAQRADDWRKRPEGWVETRYEEKSLAGVPSYLRFQRTNVETAF